MFCRPVRKLITGNTVQTGGDDRLPLTARQRVPAFTARRMSSETEQGLNSAEIAQNTTRVIKQLKLLDEGSIEIILIRCFSTETTGY